MNKDYRSDTTGARDLRSAKNWGIFAVLMFGLVGIGRTVTDIGVGGIFGPPESQRLIAWEGRRILAPISSESSKQTSEGERLAFSVVQRSAVRAGSDGTIVEVSPVTIGDDPISCTVKIELDPARSGAKEFLLYEGLDLKPPVRNGSRVFRNEILGWVTPEPSSFHSKAVALSFVRGDETLQAPENEGFEYVSRGHRLVKSMNCLTCHSPEADDQLSCDAPSFIEIGEGATEEQIVEDINTGKSFANQLTDQEKLDIARYILGQIPAPEKPEPAPARPE